MMMMVVVRMVTMMIRGQKNVFTPTLQAWKQSRDHSVCVSPYAHCGQLLLGTCFCEMEKSSNHGYHDVAKIKGNPGNMRKRTKRTLGRDIIEPNLYDFTLRCNNMNDMSPTARFASYLDPSVEQTALKRTTPCRLSAWTVKILIHQSGLLCPAGQTQMSAAPPPINSGLGLPNVRWAVEQWLTGPFAANKYCLHARGANSVHTASIARRRTSLPPKQNHLAHHPSYLRPLKKSLESKCYCCQQMSAKKACSYTVNK